MPTDSNQSSPSFGKVMGTTTKVILALVVISAGIGVVALVIGAIGTGIDRASSSSSTMDHSMYDFYTKEGEARPTSMPLSKWNRIVGAAIKEHCGLNGMTKEQIEKALGHPQRRIDNADSTVDWMYETSETVCDKYSGETCAQQHQNITPKYKLHFTMQGTFVYLIDGTGTSPGGATTSCFSQDQPLVYAEVTKH